MVSPWGDATIAGRLSSRLFERCNQVASLHASPWRRVTYSHQTDPAGTRQFGPDLPRKLTHTWPCGSTARRGKHGRSGLLSRGELCAARGPGPLPVGTASIRSGGDSHFPSSPIVRTAIARPPR